MYYCAGYTDDDGMQKPAYNLTKLLYKIVLSLPVKKRIAIAENLNDDNKMWEYDDAKRIIVTQLRKALQKRYSGLYQTMPKRGLFTAARHSECPVQPSVQSYAELSVR